MTERSRRLTPATRQKISQAKKGKPLSPEHREALRRAKRTPESRARQSSAHTGQRHTEATRAKLSAVQSGNRGGSNNGHWKAERAGYRAVHDRHKKVLPRVCAHCEAREGRLDVALSHDAPLERLLGSVGRNPGRLYFSLDPSDYIRLCRACHDRYDDRARRAAAVRWGTKRDA